MVNFPQRKAGVSFWLRVVTSLAVVAGLRVSSGALAAPEVSVAPPVSPVTVCVDSAGVVSRRVNDRSCRGNSFVWSRRQLAPRLCWDNSRLDPYATTRVVSVRGPGSCGRNQVSMSTGMKLLCADKTSGVLRWPVTRSCAPGNIPTRVIIGAEKSGQPVSSTTTSTTAPTAAVVAAPSTGEVTSTTSTTTTTIAPTSCDRTVRAFGGTNADLGEAIAVDSAGNVYTTGYFKGTVDFDPGDGTSNITSAGDNDVFVSKLDSSGNFVWAKRFGGSDSDRGFGITVDASGNVYTTGDFRGTVDFDPGDGTSNLVSAGGADVFVSKLDSSGNFVWAKRFGGTSSDDAIGIDLDSSGNVYTTGYFYLTADFDPGDGTSNLVSAGSADVFVSKLTSAGDYAWAVRFGGTNSDWGSGIALDGSSNVYTTGFFNSTVDFDPGAGTCNKTSAGLHDVFVSKLNSAGAGSS